MKLYILIPLLIVLLVPSPAEAKRKQPNNPLVTNFYSRYFGENFGLNGTKRRVTQQVHHNVWMVDNSDVIDAQGNVKHVRKVIHREEWDNPTSQAPYDWSWFISNFMTKMTNSTTTTTSKPTIRPTNMTTTTTPQPVIDISNILEDNAHMVLSFNTSDIPIQFQSVKPRNQLLGCVTNANLRSILKWCNDYGLSNSSSVRHPQEVAECVLLKIGAFNSTSGIVNATMVKANFVDNMNLTVSQKAAANASFDSCMTTNISLPTLAIKDVNLPTSYVNMIRELLNSMLNGQYGPERTGRDGKVNLLLTTIKAQFCLTKALITNGCPSNNTVNSTVSSVKMARMMTSPNIHSVHREVWEVDDIDEVDVEGHVIHVYKTIHTEEWETDAFDEIFKSFDFKSFFNSFSPIVTTMKPATTIPTTTAASTQTSIASSTIPTTTTPKSPLNVPSNTSMTNFTVVINGTATNISMPINGNNATYLTALINGTMNNIPMAINGTMSNFTAQTNGTATFISVPINVPASNLFVMTNFTLPLTNVTVAQVQTLLNNFTVPIYTTATAVQALLSNITLPNNSTIPTTLSPVSSTPSSLPPSSTMSSTSTSTTTTSKPTQPINQQVATAVANVASQVLSLFIPGQ